MAGLLDGESLAHSRSIRQKGVNVGGAVLVTRLAVHRLYRFPE
jgi:hypothetical protein